MTEETVHTTKYDIDAEEVQIIRTEVTIPISEIRWAGFTFAVTFEQAKEDLKKAICEKIIEAVRDNSIPAPVVSSWAVALEKADGLTSVVNPPRYIRE